MPGSAAAVLLAGLLATASPAPSVVLRIQDPALVESSGLAVSGRHDDVLWTQVDGGDVAEVIALDRRGRTVATIRLGDIDPYDPEALAPGTDERGRPALFLGDIGDNRLRRPDVSVFRVTEPGRLRDARRPATWWRFTYPDGPRDAEALLVDPRDGRLLIASKDVFGGGLYRAPATLRTDRPNRLKRIGDVPPLVTDGAFLPDGGYVLRSYSSVYRYDSERRLVGRALLPDQPQGESVAADGDRLLVGSEGVRSAVYAVPVPPSDRAPASASPASATPSASPSPSPRPTAASADRGDRTSPVPYVAGGLAALLVLTLVVRLARRRRPR